MATIKQTASGSYETIVYVGRDANGKRIYKHITEKTRHDVLSAVRELQAHPDPGSVDILGMTVDEAVGAYIHARERLTGESALSPSTIAKYYDYLRSDLYLALAKVKLGKLTDETIQRAIDNYAQEHSPKSVSLRWGLIRAAIAEIRKDFSPNVRLPRVKRKRLEMPDREKLQTLFADIRGKGMEIPVLLGAVCGMRRGEIAAVNLAEDIDYERGIIHINKDMVLGKDRKYVIKKPKTDAAVRSVQCPAWVLDRLAEARDSPAYMMMRPNSITTGWHRLSKAYGISCSFHGLRHYFASVMESLGVPEAYQMERMGHTTNYMLKRYQEYLKETEYSIDQSMNDYFQAIAPSVDATKDATNQKRIEE